VEAIVRSWTVIEDHPRVVSAEIEEATCLLDETEETPDHHGVEPEPVDAVVEDKERPGLTTLEAEASPQELRWRGRARNLPSDSARSLDAFGRPL